MERVEKMRVPIPMPELAEELVMNQLSALSLSTVSRIQIESNRNTVPARMYEGRLRDLTNIAENPSGVLNAAKIHFYCKNRNDSKNNCITGVFEWSNTATITPSTD